MATESPLRRPSPTPTACGSTAFALACWLACALVGLPTARAQQPTRDTVVVVQRDTLFVIQRDTVFVQPATGAEAAPADGPRAPLTPDQRREELYRAREDRRARLEQLRRERELALAALPVVRDREASWAALVYPTRLLEIDFPALTAGVTYVRRGRVGVAGTVGLLTRPTWAAVSRVPEARGPIRGLDIGGEFRYYTSPLYRRFPMYVGGGASYSVAPVRYRRLVETPERTYERFREADASGRRIRVNALIGWEFRSPAGFAVDLTTGLEFNGRGIFTDDAALAREIDNDFWNVNRANAYNPALTPVMRVGIGFGRW